MTMSSSWNATVLTLFPEMFPGPLGISLLGKTEVWTRLPDTALNADQSTGSSQRRDAKASAKTR